MYSIKNVTIRPDANPGTIPRYDIFQTVETD